MFKEIVDFKRMKYQFPPSLANIYERYNLILFLLNEVEDKLKRKIVPVYTIQDILSETASLISDTMAILREKGSEKIVEKAESQFNALMKDIDSTIDILNKSIVVGEPMMIAGKVTLLLPKIKKHINIFIKPVFDVLKEQMNAYAEEQFVKQISLRLGIVPKEEEEEEGFKKKGELNV
jgi:hypothetical protein